MEEKLFDDDTNLDTSVKRLVLANWIIQNISVNEQTKYHSSGDFATLLQRAAFTDDLPSLMQNMKETMKCHSTGVSVYFLFFYILFYFQCSPITDKRRRSASASTDNENRVVKKKVIQCTPIDKRKREARRVVVTVENIRRRPNEAPKTPSDDTATGPVMISADTTSTCNAVATDDTPTQPASTMTYTTATRREAPSIDVIDRMYVLHIPSAVTPSAEDPAVCTHCMEKIQDIHGDRSLPLSPSLALVVFHEGLGTGWPQRVYDVPPHSDEQRKVQFRRFINGVLQPLLTRCSGERRPALLVPWFFEPRRPFKWPWLLLDDFLPMAEAGAAPVPFSEYLMADPKLAGTLRRDQFFMPNLKPEIVDALSARGFIHTQRSCCCLFIARHAAFIKAVYGGVVLAMIDVCGSFDCGAQSEFLTATLLFYTEAPK